LKYLYVTEGMGETFEESWSATRTYLNDADSDRGRDDIERINGIQAAVGLQPGHKDTDGAIVATTAVPPPKKKNADIDGTDYD
jgi:hypothetical protein